MIRDKKMNKLQEHGKLGAEDDGRIDNLCHDSMLVWPLRVSKRGKWKGLGRHVRERKGPNRSRERPIDECPRRMEKLKRHKSNILCSQAGESVSDCDGPDISRVACWQQLTTQPYHCNAGRVFLVLASMPRFKLQEVIKEMTYSLPSPESW